MLLKLILNKYICGYIYELSTPDNILFKTLPLEIDSESFEALYSLYSKRIYRICLRDIGDEDEAANIVHNIFLNIWENRSNLTLDKPEHYLMRSAKLQVLKYFRDKKSHEGHLKNALSDYQDANHNTEDAIQYQELRREVNVLVMQLPHQCRRVYKMKDLDGKSTGQIAEELQISVSAVKQHIGKAVFFLRARLQR